MALPTPYQPKTGRVQPVLDDKTNDQLVEYARQTRTFLGTQLQSRHQTAADNWRMYYGKRKDRRDKVTEAWRAFISVPQVMYNTEAKTSQLLEIMFSADPPIQADPVFESSEVNSDGITKLLDYTQRANSMRKFMAATFRATSVQGTEFVKNVWQRRSVTVPMRVSMQQLKDFEQRLVEAQQVLNMPVPDWQADPAGFHEWRILANKTQRVNIPEAPDLAGSSQEVLSFLGPYIERIPFWQLFIDPLVGELKDQPCIIHEMWKPKDWVESRTGAEPTRPYDPKRVEMALGAVQGQTISDEQRALNADLNIPDGVGTNPQFFEPVLIWEVWRLNSEYPFQVILNREQVINKNPRMVPFEHGMAPFGAIRNIYVPGYAYGLSDVEPAASMVEEQNALRDMRLDKVMLHTLPIFQKRIGLGIPDMQRNLHPGGFVEVNQVDGIKPLIPGDINPSAFSEGDRIGLDIDRSYGIGDNVRGASASVGRVSATAESSRLTQALTRLKLNAVQCEDDLGPVIQQWLGLWAQYGDTESRPTLGGYDPMANLNRQQLLVALSHDYRFRGATQAVSRELMAQQNMLFGDKFGAVMLPKEIRALARETALSMGLRSVSKIITSEGTLQLEQQAQQAQQAQAQQAQGVVQQGAAAGAAAEAPSQITISEGGPQ